MRTIAEALDLIARFGRDRFDDGPGAMRSLVLIGALLTSECTLLMNPAMGNVHLWIIGEPSAGGDTLVIRLDNESRHALTYNLCFSTLELRFEDAWEAAQVGPPSGVCRITRRRLEAGATADGFFALTDSLNAGTYRLTTSVRFDGEGGSFRLRSPNFTLE